MSEEHGFFDLIPHIGNRFDEQLCQSACFRLAKVSRPSASTIVLLIGSTQFTICQISFPKITTAFARNGSSSFAEGYLSLLNFPLN
jgi:hypothetical protein